MRALIYSLYLIAVVVTTIVAYYVKFEAAILVVLVGTVVSIYGASRLIDLHEARRWPKAKAIVEASRIESAIELRKYGPPVNHYFPVITFAFRAGENTYRCNAYSPLPEDHWSFEQAEVQSILAKFPIGSEIEIQYSPSNPGSAVVTTTVSSERLSHYWAITLGGGILIGCAMAGLLAMAL